MSLEATAAMVDPNRSFVDLARAMLPELKRMMMPNGRQLERLWTDKQFDYLALALELPGMLPHLNDVLAGAGALRPTTSPSRSRWPGALAGAGVGAALTAAVSRRRTRPRGSR